MACSTKIFFIVLLHIIFTCFSFAQISKGDWLFNLSSHFSSTHVTKNTDYLIQVNNQQLSIGYFFTDHVLAGINIDRYADHTYSVIDENTIIEFDLINESTLIDFNFRYYFGKPKNKWRIFTHTSLEWESEKYQLESVFDEKYDYKNIKGRVGFGLSSRINRNLYFEPVFNLPLFSWENRNNTRYDYSFIKYPPALISAGIHFIFDKNFYAKNIENPIFKGRKINTWLFEKTVEPNTFSMNAGVGRFVSDKFLLGFRFPFTINIKEDLKGFKIGGGMFFRHYLINANRLYIFPEMSYMVLFEKQLYGRFIDRQPTSILRATFGFGVNYFLNNNVALEVNWKRRMEFIELQGEGYLPKFRKNLDLDFGLVFFIDKKKK